MSEKLGFLLLCLFLSILPIAYIDSLLLRRYNRCIKCGYEYTWHTFLLPTMIEILLFICGIAIGMGYRF